MQYFILGLIALALALYASNVYTRANPAVIAPQCRGGGAPDAAVRRRGRTCGPRRVLCARRHQSGDRSRPRRVGAARMARRRIVGWPRRRLSGPAAQVARADLAR